MIKNQHAERRCFHGFVQYLAKFVIKGKIERRWIFYVTAFCKDRQRCYVMRSDETYKIVPIDAKGRILIKGKRYGRRHWNF